ncbi:MAG: hypothetical protein ACFCVK_09620 [Acidimicrobiales bacterium]
MTMVPPEGGWTDPYGNRQHGAPPPGWWQASDHRWYPPESRVDRPSEPPSLQPTRPASFAAQAPAVSPWGPGGGTPGPVSPASPAGGGRRVVVLVLAAAALVGALAGFVALALRSGDATEPVAAGSGSNVTANVNNGGDRDTTEGGTGSTAAPVVGGATDADGDFVSCTRVDNEYYQLELVNGAATTSDYSLSIAFIDDNGGRVGDTFDYVATVRPNERLLEQRFALFDADPWSSCELLDIERFETTLDPVALGDATCEITGEGVFNDIESSVTVVNSTSEDNDYDVTVAFVDTDGVRIGSTLTFIQRVRPAESAKKDLFAGVDYADDLRCEVVGVTRSPSS